MKQKTPENHSQTIELSRVSNANYTVNPLISRLFLPRELPVSDPATAPVSLTHVLSRRAMAVSGEEACFDDPNVVRQLSMPGAFEGDATLVLHEEKGVTALLEGRRDRQLGLAVDIGTTTVAAYLCDMVHGKVLAAAAADNPQRDHGEDVVSRIRYVGKDSVRLTALRALVVRAVNEISEACLKKAGASAEEIDEVCIAGNTAMQQILAGFHPYGLRVSPCLPAIRVYPNFSAADLGLALNPGTNVYLFPVISASVGGDTLAATLAAGSRLDEGATLIVDIGTDGKLVLATEEGIWAASCAKPALASGIDFLLAKAGMEKVSRTLLTGAFDASFDPADAELIAMLPSGTVTGEILPMDNLAGVGAVIALLNGEARAEAGRILRRIKVIDLAGEAD